MKSNHDHMGRAGAFFLSERRRHASRNGQARCGRPSTNVTFRLASITCEDCKHILENAGIYRDKPHTEPYSENENDYGNRLLNPYVWMTQGLPVKYDSNDLCVGDIKAARNV